MAEAYIVAAARTAGGRKGGRLAGWHPADLAAAVLDALVERTGADPGQIEDVIMGCVMQAGEQSNNIARNAVLASKLPESVPGTSIDRQCGSSQQALHFAAQAVMSGTMDVVIAAGVESMTRVPMGLAVVAAGQERLRPLQEPEHREALSRHPVQPVHRRGDDGREIRPLQRRTRRLTPMRATSARSRRRRPASSRTRSFRCEITRADGSTDTHTIDEGIRFDATPRRHRASS